jgi:UDPglucose--hexose-1-phosphate uridylyltransferase
VGGLEAPEPYHVRWFPNRWPAFAPGAPIDFDDGAVTHPAAGAAEIVLFSPEHAESLASLGVAQVRRVVDLWAERTTALLDRPEIRYVLVFENRGREVGATIDHPHGQIYGYPFVPPAPAREITPGGDCAVCRDLAAELAAGTRIVAEHGDWVAWVPFASGYAYGLRFAPRTHLPSLPALDNARRDDLARILVDARAADTLSVPAVVPPGPRGRRRCVARPRAHRAAVALARRPPLRRVGRARERHAVEPGRARGRGACPARCLTRIASVRPAAST